MAYVDDFLTGTDTLKDMVFALMEVYVRLAKQKLYANQEICCLGSRGYGTVALLLREIAFDRSQGS